MELEGYKLGEKIGDGGMASVYKGTQLSLKRPVAVKVLKQSLLDDPAIRSRFERESIIIARLNHPNIIHVIDQGLTSRNCPYFVMEYVKSIALDKALKQGGMRLNRSLDIFIQIAKALAYAHKNGVIHRDIKPANILVDYEGFVRVLDFGIARFYGDDKTVVQTGRGDVMGTFAYMSPEQQEGSSRLGATTDIYSLGVIMYQFLTGTLPKGRFDPPSRIDRNVPAALDELVMSCLSNRPQDRPQNADQVKNELLLIAQGGHLNRDQHERAHQGVKKNFSLLDVLKEDQHGAVYLFEEQSSHGLLVIKKRDRSSRGYDECQKLAAINHQNVVNILGTSANERVYISVMEYYAGGSLADRLSRPFKLSTFYPIAIQIADGIQVAHDAGILHGNIRPSNILFSSSGVIKVADFGLDRHYEQQEDKINWYMPGAERVSIASDIYAAGILYYQMLFGDLPQRKHGRLIQPKGFSRLPQALQQLLSAMLSLDPRKRPLDFERVGDILRNACGDDKTLIKRKAKPKPAARTKVLEKQDSTGAADTSRRPILLALLLLSLALLLFSGQAYLIYTGELGNALNSAWRSILSLLRLG